jgi:flagellar biosynthesis protein FlhB
MEQKTKKLLFNKKGQVGAAGAVNAIIYLVMGTAVATILLIFSTSLSGQVYQTVETDIDSITNTTIKNSIKDSIVYGFDAMKTTGQYMPIIILAVVIALVLGLVVSFMYFGGGRMGGGSAL